MIIFISDKKMGGKDKENSHPKRSLANIFEVQLWRKRKNFHIFLRFNFNGTSFSFDNVLLNSVTANQDQGSIGRCKAFRLKDDLWTRTVPGRVVPQTPDQDNASVTVLFRANWVDWINVTSLELISNQKRVIIEPSEISEIRNRGVKPFKLGLVLKLKSNLID